MSSSRIRAVAILALCAALSPLAAHARKLTTLYTLPAGAGGHEPNGTLIYDHGSLVGTTEFGGGTGCSNGNGCGMVFEVNAKYGAETVLYSFGDRPDAELPVGGLAFREGSLFGTSNGGGTAGLGTVFSVNRTTGTETVLYSFKGGADGGGPDVTPAYYGGNLFGTTATGGTSGVGTVFALSVSTGVKTILHSFGGGHDGNNPLAGVIYQSGALYGTTQLGGSKQCFGNGCGIVFKVDAKTGAETVLYVFKGNRDGEVVPIPWAGHGAG
jgi:uncharacterized repeat protein (TIGR03803 family)